MSFRNRLGLVAGLVLALSLILLGPSGAVRAQAPGANSNAISAATSWLRGQQAADGTYGSSAATTIEVALAAAAAGEDLSTWRTAGGASLAEALAAMAGSYAADAASAGKLLTAAVAAGLDPRALGGVDLVARLQGYDRSGALAETALGQAWAMLGLGAAGESISQGAAERLIATQQADGGWEGGPGWGTDSNTTVLAIQALVAAGLEPTHASLTKAGDYLAQQVAPAGGMVYSSAWGDAADANSTAYGIQGLRALGQDPDGALWTRSGRTQTQALVAFQIAAGALEWQPGQGENLMATAQAVPALAGVVYPPKAASAPAAAPTTLIAGRPADGVLTGSRAGARALYRLAYPGGGREVGIVLTTPAAHPLILAGLGFDVYDRTGARLGGGSVTATSPERVLRFDGTGGAASEWTVIVTNYSEGMALPYRLVVTGLDSAPAVNAAVDATSPAAAAATTHDVGAEGDAAAGAVTLLDETAHGTLQGSAGGAYAQYRLVVPAGANDATVRMTFAPDDPALRGALGFTAYAPSGRAIEAVSTGAPGERVAHLGSDAGEYLVQVYNYADGVLLEYTLGH